MTGNVEIIGENNAATFCFKNCDLFTRSVLHLNDTHIEIAENLELVEMYHYNLIEYSDNYSDTAGSFYHF